MQRNRVMQIIVVLMARISLRNCTLHYLMSSFYKDQIFFLAPNTKINCVSL